MPKRIAISQSNYIPWKGYFDFINRVDEFVLYDSVQYTRRDWRNRNRIKTPNGLKWLTIPVQAGFHQKINTVEIADESWNDNHWKTLHHMYSKAPHYKAYSDVIEDLYKSANFTLLSEINEHFLTGLNRLLGIETPITRCTDYKLTEGKTKRLISICKQADADIYVSGPAARDYLDENQFTKSGIEVEWMDYSGYQEYPQQYGEFEHGVTVLDLLFNTGEQARNHMKY